MACKFDVFVSYSSADRDLVAPFVELLKRDDFTVWFDIEQMAGGPPVLGQIADGIANSTHMIACLSDAYVEREWTAFELDSNQTHDPANRRNRTIPVRFRPLTRKLPAQIHAFAVRDLTDVTKFQTEYKHITRMLRRHAPQEPNELDREGISRACKAPFKHLDEPNVALFLVRRANEALSQFLYRQILGELPPNATLDSLIQQLLGSGHLPSHINVPMGIVQTYGNIVVHDHTDDFVITRESIEPGLAALTVLAEWVFSTYFDSRQPAKHLWAEVWDGLPFGRGRAERQIPGTSYYLREPRLSVNSLGPLYPGRNAALDEPVSVNLVTLPEGGDTAFFEDVTRFKQLSDASIISPLDAGRVVVGGQRRCLYLIMPSIDGVSAQDLFERFGALPALAAYELGVGIALALEGFHDATPPIVHGDIKPANVLVGRFGTVRVLCVGRQMAVVAEDAAAGTADGRIDSFLFASAEQRSGARLTEKTDLSALQAVLFFLLSGDYEPRVRTSTPAAQADSVVAGTLERLAGCTTAAHAREVLEEASAGVADGIGLAEVVRCYREGEDLGTSPAPVAPPLAAPQQFGLVASSVVESRRAWPIGRGRVLVWEMGTETLAILEGSQLVWRDSRPVRVRRVTSGPGDQLALGGWDGSVRSFTEGSLAVSTRLNGPVGDLRFQHDKLIAGSWKGALLSIAPDGEREEFLGVDKGVFRIAVNDSGDRFAVADLAGGVAVYAGGVRVNAMPSIDVVGDIEFAGSRLVILTDEALTGLRMDGTRGVTESRPGALRLLPAPAPGSCLLLVDGAPLGNGSGTSAYSAWLIDEADRQIPYFTFPAGRRLLTMCDQEHRFTVSLPDGGCAYWRDGAESQTWPDALAATISAHGNLVAVTKPGQVELYEDPA